MRFNYKEVNSISEHGMRLYEVIDGVFLPSITTILGKTMDTEKVQALEKWKMSIGEEAANKKMIAATTAGSNIHLLAERFLKKLPLEENEFSSNELEGFNTLKIYLKKIEDVWGLEVPLFSNELGAAGRCDCVAVYKGKPCIIDFKTSSRLKSADDITDYFLQLTAYSIMHNEMFGTNITHGSILMVTGFGFPQEFNKDLTQYYSQLKDRVSKFYNLFLK